jgi:hypothetical protein
VSFGDRHVPHRVPDQQMTLGGLSYNTTFHTSSNLGTYDQGAERDRLSDPGRSLECPRTRRMGTASNEQRDIPAM